MNFTKGYTQQQKKTAWDKRVDAFRVTSWEYLGIIFPISSVSGDTIAPLNTF